MPPSFPTWFRFTTAVTMTAAELEAFVQKEGRRVGLTRAQARERCMRSGRDAARVIMRLLPTGASYEAAVKNWSPLDWDWAARTARFIARMSQFSGPFYDEQGRPTNRLRSLMLWGHDPLKDDGALD